MTAPACLVTGATGVVGPILVRRLLQEGYQVRAWLHQTRMDLPETVQVYRGDIADRNILRAAVHDVQIVFHLAAKLHVNNPAQSLKADYERVNVYGTRRLAEAAQTAGVQRFVFFSTIKVYGCSQSSEVLDEHSPLQPDSWYAETKARAETLCLSAVPATILRLAAVYGPHMKGNYLRLARALRKGWFVPIGTGSNRRTLVYEEDVATAALLAARHPAALGQIYNVSDGEIHTLDDIIRTICRALGRPVPRLRIPAHLVRMSAGLAEDILGRWGNPSPISRALVDKLLEDIAVSSIRLQQELGFCPSFTMEEGWKQTVSALLGL
jgi:UDP-glucose 4-epimerase